jgi:putative spermidine/putrescine transport system substrate-binding protein
MIETAEIIAMRISRRGVIRTALVAPALAAPPIIARAADTLTIAAYGGEYRDIALRTVIEPFEKKFSVKVIYDDSGGVDPYPRIRASRGAPGFDVAAEMVPATIILGTREKLLEPLSEREVPNIKYLSSANAKLIPPNGIVQNYQYLSMVWNTKQVEKPVSWLDYWQAQKRYGERIKGHVVAHSPANFTLAAYGLIMGARALGFDETKIDAAWKLLEEQKPYVGLVAASSAQAVPYMENEQVWIMPFWSGRASIYVNRGLPYGMTIPKEGTIALGNCSAVPVGAANKKLAYEFLNFRLEPEIQRAFCLAYFASPGRMDIGDWPAEFAASQITTSQKMDSMIFPDEQLIAREQRTWTLRWQEIMGT